MPGWVWLVVTRLDTPTLSPPKWTQCRTARRPARAMTHHLENEAASVETSLLASRSGPRSWDALLSFFSPAAHRAWESCDRWPLEANLLWLLVYRVCLTRPTARAGFRNLMAPCSLPCRPGLFHPVTLLGFQPFRGFPPPIAERLSACRAPLGVDAKRPPSGV